MANLSQAALAIGMIAAFLLLAGGLKLALVRQTRARGVLMMTAGLVIIMNVMIWTV